MTDLDTLKSLDEKTRQIVGLYAAEKARADRAEERLKKVESALLNVLKEIRYETGGTFTDLVSAINNAEKVVQKK